MAEKNLKARIVHKHDLEANWLLATNFTPKQGEIIVYDIDDNYAYERFKIGDGVKNVNALPFADDTLRADLVAQITAVDEKVDTVSALVGDTAVSEQINDAIKNSVADWNQNDENAVDFIKNKPDIATDEDTMDLLAELEMIEPVTTSDGSILTSSSGEVYSL